MIGSPSWRYSVFTVLSLPLSEPPCLKEEPQVVVHTRQFHEEKCFRMWVSVQSVLPCSLWETPNVNIQPLIIWTLSSCVCTPAARRDATAKSWHTPTATAPLAVWIYPKHPDALLQLRFTPKSRPRVSVLMSCGYLRDTYCCNHKECLVPHPRTHIRKLLIPNIHLALFVFTLLTPE